MPKEIKATPIVPTHANEERLAQAGEAAKELNALQLATTDKAKAVAVQVGYEGSFSVSSLEDEIRFYQRRTVEAILETGKRLLVLRELTPRGEFDPRLDALGFSRRTAYRFMQAAGKTANSANLALISGQMKSASAFLELVTHDDDVLEGLAEMDDIERMSASEVRQLARNLKAESEANEKLLHDKNAKIDKLSRGKGVTAPTNWEDAFKPLLDQQHVATTQIALKLGDVKNVIDAGLQIEVPENEEPSLHNARKILATKVKADLEQAKEQIEAALHYFDKTLDSWL
jgi:hypothetical protein